MDVFNFQGQGLRNLFWRTGKQSPQTARHQLQPCGRRLQSEARSESVSGDRFQKNIATKPVLLSLDIDGTLIPWRKEPALDELALARYQKALQSPELRQNSFVILNTGRSLMAIRALAPLLGQFPVDALGLNDGQQLFIRPDAQKPNTTQAPDSQSWLSGLRGKDKDADWKAHLKGWSTVKVLKSVREALQGMGFQQVCVPGQKSPFTTHQNFYVLTKPVKAGQPGAGEWVVQVRPDQAFFEISRSDQQATHQEIAEFASTLSEELRDTLQAQWPQLQLYANNSAKWSNVHVGPKGIHKAALLDYLLKSRMPEKPVAILSAGDSTNDIELLSAHQLQGVPNYPVLVGKNPRAESAIRKSAPPHLEQVAWNHLDEGLARQFAKIKPMLKQEQAPTG